MTTVLVVDDEPMVRDVVCRYLERDGHCVVTAGDGESAREIVASWNPGLEEFRRARAAALLYP